MIESCKEITLCIDSRLDCVSLVGLAVRGICSAQWPDEEKVFCIELAVCEAVNNVIEHGYKDKPGSRVQVDLLINPRHLEILIKDRGKPFDLASLLSGLDKPATDCADLPLRGRGMRIISTIMDTWTYCQNPEGHNVLRMTKDFDSVL